MAMDFHSGCGAVAVASRWIANDQHGGSHVWFIQDCTTAALSVLPVVLPQAANAQVDIRIGPQQAQQPRNGAWGDRDHDGIPNAYDHNNNNNNARRGSNDRDPRRHSQPLRHGPRRRRHPQPVRPQPRQSSSLVKAHPIRLCLGRMGLRETPWCRTADLQVRSSSAGYSLWRRFCWHALAGLQAADGLRHNLERIGSLPGNWPGEPAIKSR